jgi:hypothetical protein
VPETHQIDLPTPTTRFSMSPERAKSSDGTVMELCSQEIVLMFDGSMRWRISEAIMRGVVAKKVEIEA